MCMLGTPVQWCWERALRAASQSCSAPAHLPTPRFLLMQSLAFLQTLKDLKLRKVFWAGFLIFGVSFLPGDVTGCFVYEYFLEDDIGCIDYSQERIFWVFKFLLFSFSFYGSFEKLVYISHCVNFSLSMHKIFSLANLFLSMPLIFPSFRTIFLWRYYTIFFHK